MIIRLPHTCLASYTHVCYYCICIVRRTCELRTRVGVESRSASVIASRYTSVRPFPYLCLRFSYFSFTVFLSLFLASFHFFTPQVVTSPVPDCGNAMFPQSEGRQNYRYPEDDPLQAHGVVQDAEMRNPQHLDARGEKCLLVVKNGSAMGTTVGRVNSLESFTRIYEDWCRPGIHRNRRLVLRQDPRHVFRSW